MIKSGIYALINIANDKLYIGSAAHLNRRRNVHYCKLRANIHDNKYLQSAWNKHGEGNFKFQIVELVEDLTKLVEMEQRWITWTKCYKREFGYNLNPIASSTIGYVHSEETRKKNSKARIGRKQSEETKQKRSLALKGRKLSEENKRNISVANKKAYFDKFFNKLTSKPTILN